MKNLRKIEDFLPDPKFHLMDIKDVVPIHNINEASGEGVNLDGTPLSEPNVSDWLWDFDISVADFPKSSNNFSKLLNPNEKLSIFLAQVVNTFAMDSWKYIKTGKPFNSAISPDEKKKIKDKFKGFWGNRKSLSTYKDEKEALSNFVDELEAFLSAGKLGVSIQKESSDIILSMTAEPSSGAFKRITTSVKSYFSDSSWKRALTWLVGNVANDEAHIKWLNKTVFKSNTLGRGTTPEMTFAFEKFLVDSSMTGEVPHMENALPALNIAVSQMVDWSNNTRNSTTETWTSVLMTTHLFGLFQSLLVIGTCAWVYDMLGDTNILNPSNSNIKVRAESRNELSPNSGLTVDHYKDVDVYFISYLSDEFKEIIHVLYEDGQIGEAKYKEYLNRISTKKDSRRIIRDVRNDIIGWGNSNSYSRSQKPDVKALYTDGSTKLIIPVKMYDAIMK